MKRIIGMAAAAALVLLQVGAFAALNAEVRSTSRRSTLPSSARSLTQT
jgi:hypothetical protein